MNLAEIIIGNIRHNGVCLSVRLSFCLKVFLERKITYYVIILESDNLIHTGVNVIKTAGRTKDTIANEINIHSLTCFVCPLVRQFLSSFYQIVNWLCYI